MEWLSKLVESAQNSRKIAGAAFAFCAIILFLPAGYIDFLGLTSFVGSYRSFVALAFLASGAILAVELVSQAYSFLSELISNKNKRKRVVKRLENLTPAEAGVIREFFFGTNVCMFPAMDSSVTALVRDAVIERADKAEFKTTIFRVETIYFNYCLSTVAIAAVTPSMLGVSEYFEGRKASVNAHGIWHWQFSEAGLYWIKEHRPAFAKQPEKPTKQETPRPPTATRPIIR